MRYWPVATSSFKRSGSMDATISLATDDAAGVFKRSFWLSVEDVKRTTASKWRFILVSQVTGPIFPL